MGGRLVFPDVCALVAKAFQDIYLRQSVCHAQLQPGFLKIQGLFTGLFLSQQAIYGPMPGTFHAKCLPSEGRDGPVDRPCLGTYARPAIAHGNADTRLVIFSLMGICGAAKRNPA